MAEINMCGLGLDRYTLQGGADLIDSVLEFGFVDLDLIKKRTSYFELSFIFTCSL